MGVVAWVLDLLAVAALVWYAIMWTICLFGLYRARIMFLQTASPNLRATIGQSRDTLSLPGVSILRPLSGLDSNLYLNLCSTFTQDYPPDKYEVIFSVASPDDAALPVAREVLQRYADSGVRARLIVGDVAAGVNPKVNNLLRPYASAKHDVLWVLDSQVRLSTAALLASALQLTASPPTPSPTFIRKPLSDRVGLLHHVPLGVDADTQSLGSQVERVFLSTTHAKMYIAINSLAVDSCVMGKSNFWRKSDLERVPDRFFAVNEDGARQEDGEGALGSEAFRPANVEHEGEGFDTADAEEQDDGPLISEAGKRRVLRQSRALGRFSIYLAEDNMLALSLWKHPPGLAHALGTSPACIARTNVGEIRTLRDYIARRSRWIRVRRYMVPAATYAEPLTESAVVGLLALYALQWLLKAQSLFTSVLLLMVHFALWFVVDVSMLGILELSASDKQCSQFETPGKPLSWITRTLKAFPTQRKFLAFVRSWALREALALPIWVYAMYGGNEVAWRGQPYRILSDSRAAQLSRRRSTRTARVHYQPLPMVADT